MEIKPVVYITTQRSLQAFKEALESCSNIGQFFFNSQQATNRNITVLQVTEHQTNPAVQEITNKLKYTQNDVVVDADSLQNSLALFNARFYRKAWGITDEMMSRLYEIVYDPKAPHRAEIVQGITEALRMQDLYCRTVEMQE